MPAPRDCEDMKVVGELWGQVIIDVRCPARSRKQHNCWPSTTPIEHLEPHPAGHGNHSDTVGRWIGPACPLGVGPSPRRELSLGGIAERQLCMRRRASCGARRRRWRNCFRSCGTRSNVAGGGHREDHRARHDLHNVSIRPVGAHFDGLVEAPVGDALGCQSTFTMTHRPFHRARCR